MCVGGCVTKTPPTEVQERGPQGTGEPEEDTVWKGSADRAVGSEEEKGATQPPVPDAFLLAVSHTVAGHTFRGFSGAQGQAGAFLDTSQVFSLDSVSRTAWVWM